MAALLGAIFLVGLADTTPVVVTLQADAVTVDDWDSGGNRSLPSGLVPAAPGALTLDVPSDYDIGPVSKARYQAVNQAQGLVTTFTSSGIQIAPLDGQNDAWTHGLRLTGYGYGDHIQPTSGATLVLEGPRIEYRHGRVESDLASTMTEWYVNGPLGLEQGFTLNVPPPGGVSSEPLLFILDYDGDLSPRLTPQGDAVGWTDTEGREVLRYGGLFAFDATGAELPARMALADEALVLLIEDADAVYPIIVDPHYVTVELQPDVGGGTQQFAELGFSSAINGDGTTVIVGAPLDRDTLVGAGTAYIFVKNAGVWSQEQELQPDAGGPNRGGDNFGWSVDISSDGDTAVVGAKFAECVGGAGGCGAVYVFVRNAGAWTQQAKLQQAQGDLPGDGPHDDAESDFFGHSVSISADGLTIAVGAQLDDADGPDSGSVYIYRKNAGAWPLEKKLLRFPAENFPPPDDPTFYGQIANFGRSVSVNGAGTAVAIGAPGIPGVGPNNNLADTGSVFIYAKNGAWVEEVELEPNVADLVFDMKFGHDVALSASGTTFVGGAPQGNQNNPNSGQAFVFEKVAGTWGQQQRLTPDVNTFAGPDQCCERFGLSVATSDDGNTVLVGRDENDISNALGLAGSAHVFVRRGGQWSNDHLLQQGVGDIGQADRFGTSVGVSGDGTAAVVGAPQDDDNNPNSGSAYVFGLDTGGVITIVKDSIPDNAQDFPFGVLLPGEILFSLDDDDDATLPNTRVFLLAPGEYFAFESIGGVAGWTLSSRVCDDADSFAIEGGLLAAIGVSIDLDAGEEITCTFTNTLPNPAFPGLTVWGLIGLATLLSAVFVWRLLPAIRQRNSLAG
ncbi:MAG: hypothetical protein IIC24_04020 [Chloroflexi bacterium]|nr:hypothetical protein [Chloroflexota bacterium]